MTRTIRSMEEKYRLPSLELVASVFTAHWGEEEGKLLPGGLAGIRGQVNYSEYQSLR